MQQAYLQINGVRSKVCTWGKWVEESLGDQEEIIVVFPGNPGVTSFYELFCECLHEELTLPVWCVGHAGHNIVTEGAATPLPDLEENGELFGLKGQINHKIEFFNKYVPENAKVHLVGHSIGAYMALEVLEDPSVNSKVHHVQLLFPTIEFMADSRNGRFLVDYVRHFVWLLIHLAWVFTVLPSFIQTLLIYLFTFVSKIPFEVHTESIRDLVHPEVLRRVFYLAFEEMDEVKERNNKVIGANLDKIRILYAVTDGWIPAAFFNKIKIDFPTINIQVVSCVHDFVLRYSEETAETVSEWIRPKTN